VDGPFNFEDFLRAGNGMRVNEAVAVVPKTSSKVGAAGGSHPLAAGAAVEVDDQLGGATGSVHNFVDVWITFENRGEAGLNDDLDLEIRPMIFQEGQRRSGENAIAQGPQADNNDAGAGREPVKNGNHFGLWRRHTLPTLRLWPRPRASRGCRRGSGRRAYIGCI
jgi:hypothetical protein